MNSEAASIYWHLFLGVICLFYAIVCICVPFWIHGINKKLTQTNQMLAQLLAKKAEPSQEIIQMSRDMRVMKKIMTGETTAEEEQAKLRARADLEAHTRGPDWHAAQTYSAEDLEKLNETR